MPAIIDLTHKPADPILAIQWLSEVRERVDVEIEQAFAEAYFDARLRGQFDHALRHGPFGKKKALALTRRVNNARARMIRWGDRRDPLSSTYDGS